jgi:ppGpp synthetase/RelA/SpoT-type nucleotidyltranferase
MAGQASQDRIEDVLSASLPDELRTKAGFRDWYFPLFAEVQVAAVELYGYVAKWLDQEKERIQTRECTNRDVWSLFPDDAGRLTKSLESLRTKLGRDLLDKPPGRCLTPDEVEDRIRAMPDLARFRIVCDFASDAEELLARLLVKSEQGARFGEYTVRGPLKDYIYDLSLRCPTRGHRARQLAVEVPTSEAGKAILVEIQIMTLLQHAWDRRNHPFYEWTRTGHELPPELTINDVALAETLHMVDRQAAENWQQFLSIRKEQS